jgi:hypothetical protein
LHRAAIGVSTRDGLSDAEHAERLRREHARLDAELTAFDPDSAPNAEPAYVEFEAEQRQAK